MSLDTVQPTDANNRTIAGGSLTTYIDEGATYTYVGKAIPGSGNATGTAKTIWQIVRVTNATGIIQFASGTPFFDKEWDERTSYTYT